MHFLSFPITSAPSSQAGIETFLVSSAEPMNEIAFHSFTIKPAELHTAGIHINIYYLYDTKAAVRRGLYLCCCHYPVLLMHPPSLPSYFSFLSLSVDSGCLIPFFPCSHFVLFYFLEPLTAPSRGNNTIGWGEIRDSAHLIQSSLLITPLFLSSVSRVVV